MESIVTALITGGITLLGVLIANGKRNDILIQLVSNPTETKHTEFEVAINR